MPKLHRSLCPSMADQTVKWEHPCVTSPRDTACRTDVYVACLRILERKNWRIDIGYEKNVKTNICLYWSLHSFFIKIPVIFFVFYSQTRFGLDVYLYIEQMIYHFLVLHIFYLKLTTMIPH